MNDMPTRLPIVEPIDVFEDLGRFTARLREMALKGNRDIIGEFNDRLIIIKPDVTAPLIYIPEEWTR